MELKKGYKQTELGLIPEDWQVKRIDQVASVIGGGTPSTRVNIFWEGTINWFTPTEVGYGKYLLESKRKLTIDGLKNSSANILPLGTILLTSRAGIGDLGILNIEAATNQGFQSLIANANISNEFLYYLILTKKNELLQNASGSTFLEISPSKVKCIKIILPPLSEQIAIATALSNIDELIALTEKLIDKKKAIKQGVMQELLKPKKGWVQKKLDDVISEFQNGYGFSASGYISNGIPIVTMAQIGLDGSFNFNETKVNKWVTSDFNLLKNYHLKDGDLIIAMTDVTPEKNLIGRMTIVETNQTLLLNQRVGLLKLDKNKVNPYFLKVLSNMKDWRTYCIGSASLGVQANIGTKDITNGKMTMPNVEKQNEIAEILIDMDNEIRLAVTKLQKLKYQKQGMMQALLTGKIRLI